jgi:hypothetical protein
MLDLIQAMPGQIQFGNPEFTVITHAATTIAKAMIFCTQIRILLFIASLLY